MKVKMVFEGNDVVFVAIPDGDYEERLLMALSVRKLLEAEVKYELDSYQKVKNVRCILRPREDRHPDMLLELPPRASE